MKCRKCGGEKKGRACNLCALFASGQAYNGVEKCRGNNPQASQALKVRPHQVQDAIADARKKGVETEFTKKGLPMFTSRRHKQRYLRAYGYVNQDAGYGD